MINAELEGIKLDIAILQKQTESITNTSNEKSARENENIGRLQLKMHEMKEKYDQLEKQNYLIVEEKNIEVDALKMEISSLEDRATRAEEERDSLRLALTLSMHDKEVIKNLPGVNESEFLSEDYANNEWSRVENNCQGRLPCVTEPSLSLYNRFEALPVESSKTVETETDVTNAKLKQTSITVQVQEYRRNQDKNYKLVPNRLQQQPLKSLTEGEIVGQEKIAYVVGDSMVKNIDPNKLSKAFKGSVERQTYSGAKVKDIHAKAKELLKHRGRNSTLVIHVGTNNLVQEQEEKVADDLDQI